MVLLRPNCAAGMVEKRAKSNNLLEHQSRTLRLLVPTVSQLLASSHHGRCVGFTYPSSKCLHRFSASCAFVLQLVHSNRSTTFFVVFAFLWKTGFV